MSPQVTTVGVRDRATPNTTSYIATADVAGGANLSISSHLRVYAWSFEAVTGDCAIEALEWDGVTWTRVEDNAGVKIDDNIADDPTMVPNPIPFSASHWRFRNTTGGALWMKAYCLTLISAY